MLKRATDILDRTDLHLGDYLTRVESVEFPTTGGETAFGLFYPPRNPDYAPGAEERPPLLVKCHGGPTSSASSTLNLGVQYWTSRGIAVLDVNYRGSTGFGRAYRDRLQLNWGVLAEIPLADGLSIHLSLGWGSPAVRATNRLVTNNIALRAIAHLSCAAIIASPIDEPVA